LLERKQVNLVEFQKRNFYKIILDEGLLPDSDTLEVSWTV
jgi:hypothetical protein